MAVQGVFTAITEIAPEQVEALTALLDALDAALDEPSSVALVDFRILDSVHFARFVVLPPDSRGRRHLAFGTAYDGPRRVHLGELAKRAHAGLCRIYEHCVGFPPEALTSRATLLAYLEANAVRHGAMHVGYVGRSVHDARSEEALRRFIDERLARDGVSTTPTAKRPACAIRDEIVAIVRGSEYRWALEPREHDIVPSSVEGWWRNPAIAGSVAFVLLGGALAAAASGYGLPFAAVLLGVVGGVVATLRHQEMREPAKEDSDVESGRQHAADEDFGIRNQLTHVVDVKPGLFRRALLHFVLFAIEIRARLEFYRGDLGGIETIHCAHWLVLPGETPRLLFFSNYDGSWERYLGDFIEEAGGGMTSVWSNTVRYPRAAYLLFAGATNERVFKAWTREHQVRTQVWYAATPDISTRNLNDNSRLRDGLRGYLSEEEAREWLRLA